jgi:hypothetical protein
MMNLTAIPVVRDSVLCPTDRQAEPVPARLSGCFWRGAVAVPDPPTRAPFAGIAQRLFAMVMTPPPPDFERTLAGRSVGDDAGPANDRAAPFALGAVRRTNFNAVLPAAALRPGVLRIGASRRHPSRRLGAPGFSWCPARASERAIVALHAHRGVRGTADVAVEADASLPETAAVAAPDLGLRNARADRGHDVATSATTPCVVHGSSSGRGGAAITAARDVGA